MKRLTFALLLSFLWVFVAAENLTQLNCKGEIRPVQSGYFEIPDVYIDSFNLNNTYLSKDGKPWLPVMGEFHYLRFPEKYWNDQLGKMKAAGINIVATYVFWNHHEVEEGSWKWDGNNNLRKFIELCKENNLYVWLRIGPYCNAEAVNGGIPKWALSGKRTNDSGYIAKVRDYFSRVAGQVQDLYVKDGGPVVGLQLENEFAHGDPDHITMLKQIAVENGIIVPFYSLTGNSEFHHEKYDFLPLQGAYAFRGWQANGGGIVPGFAYDNDQWAIEESIGKLYYDIDKYPRGLCEQGTGSPMKFHNRFLAEPAVIESHVQNQIGRGMNLIGYYMFQGGTQVPGLNRGLEGWPLSYDFQAPLGEFGQVQTSYKSLKLYHLFLNAFGSELAQTQIYRSEAGQIDASDKDQLRLCGRFSADSGFVFVNNTQKGLELPERSIKLSCLTESGSVNFPQQPFVLRNNECVIFPVGQKLADNLTLEYATAQLLTKVSEGSVDTLFFIKKNAMNPEFSFSETPSSVTGTWNVVDGVFTAASEPVETEMSFVFNKNGKTIRIVLLSLEDGLNSYYFEEKNRFFITDADVSINGADTVLYSRGSQPCVVKVYNAETGIFSRKEYSKELYSPEINMKKSGYCRKQIVELPAQLPENVSDVYLNIDYRGAEAKLYAGRNLYTDHYFYGRTWTIGLKRFIADSNVNSLKLKFKCWSPIVNGISKQHRREMYKKITPYFKDSSVEVEYIIRPEL
jgi:hypothetical protein